MPTFGKGARAVDGSRKLRRSAKRGRDRARSRRTTAQSRRKHRAERARFSVEPLPTVKRITISLKIALLEQVLRIFLAI